MLKERSLLMLLLAAPERDFLQWSSKLAKEKSAARSQLQRAEPEHPRLQQKAIPKACLTMAGTHMTLSGTWKAAMRSKCPAP